MRQLLSSALHAHALPNCIFSLRQSVQLAQTYMTVISIWRPASDELPLSSPLCASEVERQQSAVFFCLRTLRQSSILREKRNNSQLESSKENASVSRPKGIRIQATLEVKTNHSGLVASAAQFSAYPPAYFTRYLKQVHE